MIAIWVLLGKSRYPATFYQSYASRAWETEVPFDLIVDYVPELLRAPDTSLQHLAARSPQDVEGCEAVVARCQEGTGWPASEGHPLGERGGLDVPVVAKLTLDGRGIASKERCHRRLGGSVFQNAMSVTFQ